MNGLDQPQPTHIVSMQCLARTLQAHCPERSHNVLHLNSKKHRSPPPNSLNNLPQASTENLPENAEATTDLTYEDVKYLKIANEGLVKPLTQFLKSSSPDWIFFDFAPYWLPSIAKELNISSVHFNIFAAYSLAFFGPTNALLGTGTTHCTRPEDFTVKPNWVPFETSIALQLFEVPRFSHESMINSDKQNVPASYRLAVSIAGCDLVAVKSCNKFEPEWFRLLEKLHGKPALAVGFLAGEAADDSVDDGEWSDIKEWLDNQKKGSVVYIAFGSEAIPSQEELTVVAHGLELSELPFLWVVWNLAQKLPVGFQERVKTRGLVRTGWVSQPKILSHSSIGCFLTHGGWGSIVDGIQFGRPLVVLTFLAADQGLNAMALEEKMGYTIPRDEQDGTFTRDSVPESLKLVMLEEQGRVYRDKANEMSQVFGDSEKQDQHVDNLLKHLQNHQKLKIKEAK